MNDRYATVHHLAAEEKRVEEDLVYTSVCKNTGKVKVFDYSKKAYALSHHDILSVWVWAAYKRRNAAGNESQTAWYDRANLFFDFLKAYGIKKVEELDSRVIARFVEWLKQRTGLSYASAGSSYRSLRPQFEQMRRHPKVTIDLYLPKNAFPKSSSLQAVDLGYDKNEMKQILKAVVEDLREKKDSFESKYEHSFLGKKAPLEGVAEVSSKTGFRSKWATHEHRVWYFENILNCNPLVLCRDLYGFPGGQSFRNSFNDHPRHEYGDIKEFYSYIKAGPGYQPKYLGEPSPVRYLTPWKKREYVIWYWENIMGSQYYTFEECKLKFREFNIAMKEHWGSAAKFFRSMNAWRWISSNDLAPYYLMLIIRTGMNPSTVQRLTIDCLELDPTDPSRKFINWKKYRSHKGDRTIPEMSSRNDTWAVSIVERVIEITSAIRTDQNELWISNENPLRKTSTYGPEYFRMGVRRLFESRPVFSSKNGEKLDVVAKSIRPTIAWDEYLRTEDLRYLQTLLGHSKVTVTAEYLRRVEDPLFRSRRAIHQEAMFIGLTQGKEDAKQYLSDAGVNKTEYIHEKFHEGVLNHCKDPFNGAGKGQVKGEMCDADLEICQGCQNLVITPYDIKKYFCYMSFNQYINDIGEISDAELEKATSYKRNFWETYILPKYPATFIEKIREDAEANPIDVWDPKRFEGYKS